jgi:hypothetical protein
MQSEPHARLDEFVRRNTLQFGLMQILHRIKLLICNKLE